MKKKSLISVAIVSSLGLVNPAFADDLAKERILNDSDFLSKELPKKLNFPTIEIFVARKKGEIAGVATLKTEPGSFLSEKSATLDIVFDKNSTANDNQKLLKVLLPRIESYIIKRGDIDKVTIQDNSCLNGFDSIFEKQGFQKDEGFWKKFSHEIAFRKLSDKTEIPEIAQFISDARFDSKKILNVHKFTKNLEANLDNPQLAIFTARKGDDIIASATMNVVQDPSLSGYVTIDFDISAKARNPKERNPVILGLVRRLEDYVKNLNYDIYSLSLAAPYSNRDWGRLFERNGFKLEGTGYSKDVPVHPGMTPYPTLTEYAKDRNLLPQKLPTELLDQHRQILQKVRSAFPEMVIEPVRESDYPKLSKLYEVLNKGVKKDPDFLKKSYDEITKTLDYSDYPKLSKLYEVLNKGVKKDPDFLKKSYDEITKTLDYVVLVLREKKDGPIIGSVSLEKKPGLSGECQSYLHPDNLIIDKAYTGKGIGITTLLACYNVAVENGCSIGFIGDNWRLANYLFYGSPVLGIECNKDYYEKQLKKVQLPEGYESGREGPSHKLISAK